MFLLGEQPDYEQPSDRSIGAIASVLVDFRPGDMQFINNDHVLHGRTSYVDDRETGKVRHLKRLWLETEVLGDRPPHFTNLARSRHWGKKRVISRLDARNE
jgi:Taurine catabolism dioxygenase TauD, TfdA family